MSTTKVSLPRRYEFQQTFDQYSNTGSGVITDHLVHNRVLTGNGQVTYGSNIGDWRERIALGLSATTALEGTSTLRMEMQGGSITARFGYPYVICHQYGDLFSIQAGVPSASTGLDAIAERKAASKFLSKYIAATNTWRGGNFMAEIRETIQMLRHPSKLLYHKVWEYAGSFRKFRNVKRLKRKHVADYIADTWLGFVFGVKPLIADCNDAGKALERIKNGSGHDTMRISGYGDNRFMDKTIFAHSVPPGAQSLNNFFAHYSVKHQTCRYYGALKAQPADRYTAFEQAGFTVFDIVPAAYEAMPWSFFLDYFGNINEILDSCKLWTADFAWVNRTIRNSTALTQKDIFHVPVPGNLECSISGGRFYALARYVKRSTSAIPYPSFHFKMPGSDSAKWLNIAALAEQIFSSRPRF